MIWLDVAQRLARRLAGMARRRHGSTLWLDMLDVARRLARQTLVWAFAFFCASLSQMEDFGPTCGPCIGFRWFAVSSVANCVFFSRSWQKTVFSLLFASEFADFRLPCQDFCLFYLGLGSGTMYRANALLLL